MELRQTVEAGETKVELIENGNIIASSNRNRELNREEKCFLFSLFGGLQFNLETTNE